MRCKIVLLGVFGFIFLGCFNGQRYPLSENRAIEMLSTEKSTSLEKGRAIKLLAHSKNKAVLPLLIRYLDNTECYAWGYGGCYHRYDCFTSLNSDALNSLSQLTRLFDFDKDCSNKKDFNECVMKIKKWWNENKERIYYDKKSKLFKLKNA